MEKTSDPHNLLIFLHGFITIINHFYLILVLQFKHLLSQTEKWRCFILDPSHSAIMLQNWCWHEVIVLIIGFRIFFTFLNTLWKFDKPGKSSTFSSESQAWILELEAQPTQTQTMRGNLWETPVFSVSIFCFWVFSPWKSATGLYRICALTLRVKVNVGSEIQMSLLTQSISPGSAIVSLLLCVWVTD